MSAYKPLLVILRGFWIWENSLWSVLFISTWNDCINCHSINFEWLYYADLQELRDLETAYQAKRRVMVDEALNKLHADYDKQRSDLLRRHQEELAALQVLWGADGVSLRVMELFSSHSSFSSLPSSFCFSPSSSPLSPLPRLSSSSLYSSSFPTSSFPSFSSSCYLPAPLLLLLFHCDVWWRGRGRGVWEQNNVLLQKCLKTCPDVCLLLLIHIYIGRYLFGLTLQIVPILKKNCE